MLFYVIAFYRISNVLSQIMKKILKYCSALILAYGPLLAINLIPNIGSVQEQESATLIAVVFFSFPIGCHYLLGFLIFSFFSKEGSLFWYGRSHFVLSMVLWCFSIFSESSNLAQYLFGD